jgi:hypothetical protein
LADNDVVSPTAHRSFRISSESGLWALSVVRVVAIKARRASLALANPTRAKDTGRLSVGLNETPRGVGLSNDVNLGFLSLCRVGGGSLKYRKPTDAARRWSPAPPRLGLSAGDGEHGFFAIVS